MNNTLIIDYNELLNKAASFDGWLSELEQQTLFEYASNLSGRGVLVEIGSWCGKSLTILTAGAIKANHNNKIYSIDPYLTSKDEDNKQYENLINNLKNCNILDKITQIKEKSQIVGENFSDEIEFIFIDGFHKYEFVKKDYNLFSKKVVDNGYIAFHDVGSYYGPIKVCKEILENNELKAIGLYDSLFIGQKVEKLTEEDKQYNSKVIVELNKLLEKTNLVY